MEAEERRLFVCDPACVQEIGHNVHALRYFKEAFENKFHCVIPICCEVLPEQVAQREGFQRLYRFYYSAYFSNVEAKSEQDRENDGNSFLLSDFQERVATEDAKKIFQRYQITSSDVILFPHLDFYGVIGLLNALDGMPPKQRPTVFLRFIGVMENATPQYFSPVNELLFRIIVSAQRGTRFRVSAETPRYADAVAHVLQMPVAVTGYPLEPQLAPLPNDGPFFFYCPGSARADKGFFELREIFQEVRRRDPECNIRFITQNLPHREAKHHLNYVAQLYAIPGVSIQDGSVSAEEMKRTYQMTHAVILPYATDIYEYRGSAVLMEAAAYGRPAITYDGTGLAEVVRYFNLGSVVGARTDMVYAAIDLAHRARNDIEISAHQAAFRFHTDNLRSYDAWFDI